MSLESRRYVATLEDVAEITREVLTAQKANSEGRATYLRALIATTQAELGQNPRQRATEVGKLSQAGRDEQLAVLEAVGKRFYGAVIKAAKEKITGLDRGGRELNKRTTFARTSMTAIRRWVKAGNDITSLVASRVTKAALTVPGRRRGPSPKVLTNRTRRFATQLEKTLATLASAEPEMAAEQWSRVRAQLERIFRKGAGVRMSRAAQQGYRASA